MNSLTKAASGLALATVMTLVPVASAADSKGRPSPQAFMHSQAMQHAQNNRNERARNRGVDAFFEEPDENDPFGPYDPTAPFEGVDEEGAVGEDDPFEIFVN